MWDVTVAADLVGGVNDDHSLAELIGKQARAFAKHRCLSDARSAEQQDALAADDYVADDLARSGHGATHAHRETGDAPRPVAYRRDAMQRALDTGPVIVPELTNVVRDVLQVGPGDGAVSKQDLTAWHARFGLPTKVEHYLQKLCRVCALVKRTRKVCGQRACEKLDLLVPVGGSR